ncbi:M56 family peptidase, partial [Streptomyces zaomyceticus]
TAARRSPTTRTAATSRTANWSSSPTSTPARAWPPVGTAVGLAAWGAACGATVSALSSANSAVTLFLVLRGVASPV